MGGEPDNVAIANTEKTTYDKTFKNMKIGVCEMQGWRRTMEDAAIVLPNYERNTSLFGVLDGHGGSIISEFVSVNFKNILVKCKSYKKGHYEKALFETFLIVDELLKNKKINNFIYETHYQQDKEKEKIEEIENKRPNKESIIKLRFERGEYDFDLDEIDLGNETDSYETIIFDYKNNSKKNIEKNIETNLTADDSDIRLKLDQDLNKEEEVSNKNLQLNDIFFQQSGKQNASLNDLPSFDEVFNIKKCRLKFRQKQIQTTPIENSGSSNSLKYQPLIAYEMGTTANIMLIKNNVIYIANVGDSLSVMYKDKKAYNLNREHQVVIEEEKERVIKSGATIQGYRINGMLNLTRALGDIRFKKDKNLKRHEQSVLAFPEITRIDDMKNIEFIIMGCDGVWDCVKRQMLCEYIEKEIKENPQNKLSDILATIFDKCISPFMGKVLGTDNMSCIVIQFLNNSSEKIEEKIKIHKVDINIKEDNKEKIVQETTY